MNTLLRKLGVPDAIQVFFDTNELIFAYGEHFEHFDAGFHRVPTTRNLWLAGKELTREVIITSCAMEAIAYAALNLHRFPSLESLSFIAIGNLPHAAQLDWIRKHYPKRKFTLVFGNDLLGRLADIKVAARLQRYDVRIFLTESTAELDCNGKNFRLDLEKLSLSAFEKIAGIRTGVRTHKPKTFDTFLEQLKYDAKQ